MFEAMLLYSIFRNRTCGALQTTVGTILVWPGDQAIAGNSTYFLFLENPGTQRMFLQQATSKVVATAEHFYMLVSVPTFIFMAGCLQKIATMDSYGLQL